VMFPSRRRRGNILETVRVQVGLVDSGRSHGC
jgi:hypothetical protein